VKISLFSKQTMKVFVRFCMLLAVAIPSANAALRTSDQQFIEKHCFECHDSEVKKGGLDLTALKFDPANFTNFSAWVLVHDRVSKGEMPPKKKARPEAAELQSFTQSLASSLISAERVRLVKEGRATQRRLNRYEYENALRDLLHAPWLQIRDALPEDGEAHRFNKVGEALDMSHVQMARYLSAAEYGLRQAMAQSAEKPELKVRRYYARDQRSYTGTDEVYRVQYGSRTGDVPVLGFEGQPEVRRGTRRSRPERRMPKCANWKAWAWSRAPTSRSSRSSTSSGAGGRAIQTALQRLLGVGRPRPEQSMVYPGPRQHFKGPPR
jgi:hypothetical protein